jgi:copper chaperone CopZ
MTETPDYPPVEGYDRARAAEILARLVHPTPFLREVTDAVAEMPRRPLQYQTAPLIPELGSHLTASQLRYLSKCMPPCTPEQVTSATHRITWKDSGGVPNVAHIGPSRLGAVVPIAAREAMLLLLAEALSNTRLVARIAALTEADRAVLAATTTDGEPTELIRIALEAAARVLVQHAYLADDTPYPTPAEFARGLLRSDIFATVATTWYWELQASSYRRGMIPVRLVSSPGGAVRYSTATVSVLRDMKMRTIARAHDVMDRATGTEGLTVAEAVRRYYHELDDISKQYALLPKGEQPRCLGMMPVQIDGTRVTALPVVATGLVEAFVSLLDRLDVEETPLPADEPIIDVRQRTFHVPDMNCAHCQRTITGMLQGQGLVVNEVDLISKRVTAEFETVGARQRAIDAIRDAGYTVIPPSES